jgi:hypothetical protein
VTVSALAFVTPRGECRRVRLSLALIILVACSHPPAPQAPKAVASTWKGPEILGNVPADTPYLFGMLEPMPPAVRDKLFAQSGVQVKEALEKAASSEQGKAGLAAGVLLHELDGVDPAHWIESLGLSPDARFVLYGMSIWPVLRVEVKDAARVRDVIGKLMQIAGPEVKTQTVAGKLVWEIVSPKAAIVVAVLDREVVAAVVPTPALDKLLPDLLGDHPPAKSLRDAPVLPALLAKHRFLPTMVGYLDVVRTIDAVSGRGKGQYDELDAMFAGLITAPCQDDLARIAGVLPRIVLGYRRLDERGFVAAMAIESPASIIKPLQKLHTPMPAMPLKTQPMLAFGAAVNVDEMFAWMRDVTSALRSRPFRCDSFASFNHDIDDLAIKLDQPMPPIARGLRGFELVVDDASVMPPSGTGHLLVVGDHMADLVHQLVKALPMFASLNLESNGVPVAVPIDQLGVPGLKSAHVALRETRAALAIGDSSATRASERLAAPDAHAPLLTLSYDLPKLRERFGMFLKSTDFANLSNVGSTSMALDVGEDGIYIDMVGTWAHGSR